MCEVRGVFKEECSEWRVDNEEWRVDNEEWRVERKSGGGVRVFRQDLPFEERKRRHCYTIRYGA
jgi:hypothetical protein